MFGTRFKAFLPALLLTCGCTGLQTSLWGPDPLIPVRRQVADREFAKAAGALSGGRIPELPRRSRAEAYRLLGLSYERLNDPAKALQTYQFAAGVYPKDINILSALADLLRSVGLSDRARPYYMRVLAIHPNNAGGNLGLGEIYREQGFLAKSQQHYESALAEWRDNAAIWRQYAEVLDVRGNLAGADRAIAKSLELAPRDVETLLVYSRLERRRTRKAAAYARIEAAASLAPERALLRLEKALWLLEDGELAQAHAIASDILSRQPPDPLALWIRASVALRRSDYSGARRDLTSAAAAPRTHPFIARTSARMLQELPKTP